MRSSLNSTSVPSESVYVMVRVGEEASLSSDDPSLKFLQYLDRHVVPGCIEEKVTDIAERRTLACSRNREPAA